MFKKQAKAIAKRIIKILISKGKIAALIRTLKRKKVRRNINSSLDKEALDIDASNKDKKASSAKSK
ncbi:hypothetical protein HBI21_247080 [Parastagonospora nodorum]|nr:hypothetical protein HBI21_247080 [Parastagonospora nodorum]